MSDLRELYQEVILDHNRRPRNFRALEDATHSAAGHNPLCGDNVTVSLILTDGVVTDIAFQGSGCAISTASASLLTEAVKGKTEEEIQAIFGAFQELVTGRDDNPDIEALGKLAVFEGVREFPMRVKCATLAWHTVRAALDNKEAVTTE
ncbi:MAG: SUF system NifU family Fe-S cluster assembly protein [Proteobacteria bacterium]|nr:SUF system NifU family Fe-S cluster assembly protein [Pseudomonadota bacterium]